MDAVLDVSFKVSHAPGFPVFIAGCVYITHESLLNVLFS
jgi:hypothetical protein